MKEIFINTARVSGAEDLEAFEKVVVDAAGHQRSVIEELLNSDLVHEETFLRNLSEELAMEWKAEIKPKGKRELKRLCGAQLALKFRLMPLWYGEGDEPDEEEEVEFDPSPEGEDEVPETDENGEVIVKKKTRSRLKLATYDPFNLYARQAASQMVDHPIEWCMASRTKILEGLQKLYGVGADTFEQILKGRDLDLDALDIDKDDANIIDEDDEEASVVKFVNTIIRQALDERATDIHVEPLHDDLRIRYRIDGKLHDIAVPDNIRALQSSVIARLKIMAKLDIAERRMPQDGRINLQLDEQGIDVRVATIPTVEGESVSLRLLNQQKFTIARLGLVARTRKVVDQLLSMSNGIILITGPTGSGKSTTLYTFLSELNKPDTRIVTIEDPVENKLEGVMQIAVKSEINLTFATGLRSILRGDPNIVMIGEIRDLETAEIAVRASLTGHLVFSTLHTNDSIGGISRLTDMGVEPFLVSAAVRAFLAQRLVRKLCSHCKEPTSYKPEYLTSIGFPMDAEGQMYKRAENGCEKCRGVGFFGRMAIYEIALVTPEMQELIVKKKSASILLTQAVKDGFVPMRQYGYLKTLSGDTTLEEVVSATTSELTAWED
jgi:type II secretory ATPase GspE/PulE/Tfp pilus assembly ATPase PilB-like protein